MKCFVCNKEVEESKHSFPLADRQNYDLHEKCYINHFFEQRVDMDCITFLVETPPEIEAKVLRTNSVECLSFEDAWMCDPVLLYMSRKMGGAKPKQADTAADEEYILAMLELDALETVPVSGGIRHKITIQEQADQLMSMSDYSAGIMSRVRTLYSNNKYDKVVDLLTDCDVHKRVIELVRPNAGDKINKQHQVCRVITSSEKDLEKLNDS